MTQQSNRVQSETSSDLSVTTDLYLHFPDQDAAVETDHQTPPKNAQNARKRVEKTRVCGGGREYHPAEFRSFSSILDGFPEAAGKTIKTNLPTSAKCPHLPRRQQPAAPSGRAADRRRTRSSTNRKSAQGPLKPGFVRFCLM